MAPNLSETSTASRQYDQKHYQQLAIANQHFPVC